MTAVMLPAAMVQAAEHVGRQIPVRKPELPLQKCAVRQSKKHGRGLFATQDIAGDEFITFYPADGISFFPAGGIYGDSNLCVEARSFPGKTAFACSVYAACFPDLPDFNGGRVEIVGDPNQIEDAAYLGHIANDACKITKPEQIRIYTKASMSGANADIGTVPRQANTDHKIAQHEYRCGTLQLGLWATKPIRAGEEIFVHYGAKHWLDLETWLAEQRGWEGKEIV